MAENYKRLYEQTKKMLTMYQDEVVPGLRKIIDDLGFATGNNVGCKWIPVAERLPESGKHVLVACEMRGRYVHGQYVCDGYYAAPKSIKGGDYDDCATEYDEDDDEYYLLNGWYEVIKNWDDYNSIVIHDFVTHWMPLPEPPEEEMRPNITGQAMEAIYRMGEKAHEKEL